IAEDATAFDIRGVPLSHHEGRCTFETIILRYSLVDPALEYIARIVHEADLADDVYDAPEAPGLDTLMRGLSMVRADEELLAITSPLLDGLYAYFKALKHPWEQHLISDVRMNFVAQALREFETSVAPMR